MRHAYLIIAHNEPEVLATLLHLLDAPDNDLYLHIDRRARALRERFEGWQPTVARYFLLEEAQQVPWGDIAMVDTEMLLLQTARRNGPYAYYHLLSGCDLPLHPAAEIRAFFDRHQGTQFVNFWSDAHRRRDLYRKVAYHYLFTRHLKDRGTAAHALTTPLRKIFLLLQHAVGWHRRCDVDFRSGSLWFSITEEACHYVLSQGAALRRRLVHTLCPDEIFLQTLLWNSPFRSSIYHFCTDIEASTCRKIDWERGGPYQWREKDREELATTPALFARKFSGQTPTLLCAIRQQCDG
jgi:hypothetical protein